jgi:hypothetical protein
VVRGGELSRSRLRKRFPTAVRITTIEMAYTMEVAAAIPATPHSRMKM